MKIEKKVIVLSILALTIGIATILPLAYVPLKGAAAQNSPFFDSYLERITVIPDIKTLYSPEEYGTSIMDETSYLFAIGDSSTINIHMCYDITPNGANLKEVDAKIEVYQFHFYSDQTSIFNATSSVGITGNVSDPSKPNGVTTSIISWDGPENTYTFADGSIYNITEVLGYVEGSTTSYSTPEWISAAKGHCNGGVGVQLRAVNGEKTVQAMTNLRNAQTIYVDITRVLQITYKHSSSSHTASVITTTHTSKEVLYHIEIPVELDEWGRAVYEIDHEGYIPTFEDLGLDSRTMFGVDMQLITRAVTTKFSLCKPIV
jgi:hypothetical protein